LSPFPGVPHGEAKLVDFVRVIRGVDRENVVFLFNAAETIQSLCGCAEELAAGGGVVSLG
jgi:hypothetical protein